MTFLPHKKTTVSNLYKTTDFYLAAYLRAAGFPADKPEFDGRRATFVFQNVDPEILVCYYNASETHRVSAQGLITAIKQTREILYNLAPGSFRID